MTNKNCVLNKCENMGVASSSATTPCISKNNRYTIQCFTPRGATGTVSMVNTTSTTSRKMTTDQKLSVIPPNAIIDNISFFGINGFTTKGTFSIGLGQLNGGILTPLIENTTATIANEKVGGCREFTSNATDGKNVKTLVLVQSNINIILEHPITNGNLQVIIEYHLKPSPM
jgi:hypothetical protein